MPRMAHACQLWMSTLTTECAGRKRIYMRPLHYKIGSWLLSFVIGVASTFVAQSCLRSVARRCESQLEMPALKAPSLPDKVEAAPPEEATTAEDDEPKRSIALKFRKYSVSEKAEGFYENAADYPQLEILTTEEARRFNRYIEDSIRNGDILKYNQRDLSRIAASESEKQKEWLRSFLHARDASALKQSLRKALEGARP